MAADSPAPCSLGQMAGPRPLRSLVAAASERLGYASRRRRAVVDEFTKLYYESPAYWQHTRWLGIHAVKSPLDLWVYQEIIWETRPDVIVETGTYLGGSALFLASICEAVGHGRVVSIDISTLSKSYPEHARITYLGGRSSIDSELSLDIGDERGMVILDSDHSCAHVLAELERFAPLVAPGCYLIVDDTVVNGHPVRPHYGEGPMEALDRFLPRHPEFRLDRTREKHLTTFNPRGYLRRVSAGDD